MDIALACENGLALEHFSKDTASAPHVDGRGIPSELEEQLWWPVPSRYHEARVLALGVAVASPPLRHGLIVVSGEAKVGYLQPPAVVDEEIGSFHVAMQNVAVVEIAQALKELQHVALDLGLLKADVRVVQQA